MIGDIIGHARMSRNKSKELAFEKKKTELLLYEVTLTSTSFNETLIIQYFIKFKGSQAILQYQTYFSLVAETTAN